MFVGPTIAPASGRKSLPGNVRLHQGIHLKGQKAKCVEMSLEQRPAAPVDGVAAAVAASGATLMIAVQVSSKATRDALFLANFSISSLATMLFLAALVSLASLLWASRAMARQSPERVIALVFVTSGIAFGIEWVLLQAFERSVAVLLYLHVAAVGSLLVSGFWSVVNERFDPRTARRKISLIAGGGALGGLLGGVAAERTGAFGEVSAMLPAMALAHLTCAFFVHRLVSRSGGSPTRRLDGERGAEAPTGNVRATDARAGSLDGVRHVARAPYLRNLALLILATTAAATMVDYTFKARAVEIYSEGESLMRFFAVFYSAVGFGTFLLQSLLAGRTLDRLGPAGTALLLPATLAAGGVALFVLPGLAIAGAVRGGETSIRGSLFRSGYELLYMPIPPSQKRSAKSIVDVGVDRIGDAASALLIGIFILFAPAFLFSAVAVAVVVLASAAVYVALRLRRNYLDALKNRLVDRAGELDIEAAALDRSAALPSLGRVDISRASTVRPPAPDAVQAGGMPDDDTEDGVLVAVRELRSGSAERIRACLEHGIDTEVAGHAVGLLARNDVADAVIEALGPMADKISGQLADWLTDPETVFAIRRRIPRILARSDSPQGIQGLVDGLGDTRFEVRYQCAAAMEKIASRRGGVAMDRELVHRRVVAELAVGPLKRRTYRLIDEDRSIRLDSLLADRIDLGLEHVFRLLSFVYEREPLQVALRGLYTSDSEMRGTALEYLESLLPDEIYGPLSPYFEHTAEAARPGLEGSDVRSTLLALNDSIREHLEELVERPSGWNSHESGRGTRR